MLSSVNNQFVNNGHELSLVFLGADEWFEITTWYTCLSCSAVNIRTTRPIINVIAGLERALVSDSLLQQSVYAGKIKWTIHLQVL